MRFTDDELELIKALVESKIGEMDEWSEELEKIGELQADKDTLEMLLKKLKRNKEDAILRDKLVFELSVKSIRRVKNNCGSAFDFSCESCGEEEGKMFEILTEESALLQSDLSEGIRLCETCVNQHIKRI